MELVAKLVLIQLPQNQVIVRRRQALVSEALQAGLRLIILHLVLLVIMGGR